MIVWYHSIALEQLFRMIYGFYWLVKFWQSNGQIGDFNGQAWFFGHNFIKCEWIFKIFIPFNRVAQELSNDTKFYILTLYSKKLWSKKCKIIEILEANFLSFFYKMLAFGTAQKGQRNYFWYRANEKRPLKWAFPQGCVTVAG